MAGGFFKSSLEAYRSHDLEVIRERATPVKNRDGLAATAFFPGAFTDNLPVTLISDRDRSGKKFRSFFEDYYNRVYFLPPNINFGPISATAERDFVVWNAHLNATELSTITLANAEGLSLDGPAVPYTFKPLELVTYTLTASIDGPATLDADATFVFDTPETFVLEVLGTRARVSPVVPNWRRPYEIEYQFKTEVFTSRSGKEQRRALRTTPRKKLSFEATPTFGAFRAFNELMATWHNNTIILPEVPRQAILGLPLDAGSAIAQLTETAPDWIVEDATIVLNYRGQYETRRVQSVAGSQVVFTGVSGTDWPVGTKLHPGVSGRLAATIRTRRETNAVAVVQVEMDVTPASEPVVALPDAPASFNGRELFMIRPNWAELPDVTYESDREEIDYDRGRIAIFTPVEFTTRVTRQTFTGRAYEDMNLIREHFERMKGQRGEFYMPTWESDIVPGPLVPAGSNTIRIYGTQFADQYQDSTVFKAVTVQFMDGTVQHNVVEDIYSVDDADGQDSVIQVATAWSQDISPENVKLASWLLVRRHATDTLTIEWLTNTVGQCQLTVQTLEDLPA